MTFKTSAIIIVGLIALAGVLAYLVQAVEPPRRPVVKVLDNEQFTQ